MTHAALHLLAVDHRNSLLTGMAPIAARPVAEQAVMMGDVKRLVFDGLLRALERGVPRASAGMLIDAEFGADVARDARAAGLTVALPVERSGQRELVLEDGRDDGLRRLIDDLDPTHLKVLVRYNPGGDATMNARQRATLRTLAVSVGRTRRPLMLELLVPAEDHQLAAVGGDVDRYDDEVRPGLVVRAMGELIEGGVVPAIWKIEGIRDAASCRMVAVAARSGSAAEARCVVLGRGADPARVEEWLRTAAPIEGFDGFAVGRTIWWHAVETHLLGSSSRADAVDEVATNYCRVVDVHSGARV